MILECILTTVGPTGRVNIAPMGVIPREERLLLRPYVTTVTYANLAAGGAAVVNITDDATVFAYSALADFTAELLPAAGGRGYYLADACSYWELAVDGITANGERATADCRVLARHRLRDFIGYNRARAAILEATILATRRHLRSGTEIAGELAHLAEIVRKCGDEAELAALAFIQRYVSEAEPRQPRQAHPPRPSDPSHQANPPGPPDPSRPANPQPRGDNE